MICPWCDSTTIPAASIGQVHVCGLCGSTFVELADGNTRRGVHKDVEDFSPTDLMLLRRARGVVIRGETPAP